MLRIHWFDSINDGFGTQLQLIGSGITSVAPSMQREAYNTACDEKTEELMEKLISLGFSLRCTSDSATEMAIDEELKYVELHSAKTYTFRKA